MVFYHLMLSQIQIINTYGCICTSNKIIIITIYEKLFYFFFIFFYFFLNNYEFIELFSKQLEHLVLYHVCKLLIRDLLYEGNRIIAELRPLIL